MGAARTVTGIRHISTWACRKGGIGEPRTGIISIYIYMYMIFVEREREREREGEREGGGTVSGILLRTAQISYLAAVSTRALPVKRSLQSVAPQAYEPRAIITLRYCLQSEAQKRSLFASRPIKTRDLETLNPKDPSPKP